MYQTMFPSLLSVVFAAWKDPVPAVEFLIVIRRYGFFWNVLAGYQLWESGAVEQRWWAHTEIQMSTLKMKAQTEGLLKGCSGDPRAGRKVKGVLRGSRSRQKGFIIQTGPGLKGVSWKFDSWAGIWFGEREVLFRPRCSREEGFALRGGPF